MHYICAPIYNYTACFQPQVKSVVDDTHGSSSVIAFLKVRALVLQLAVVVGMDKLGEKRMETLIYTMYLSLVPSPSHSHGEKSAFSPRLRDKSWGGKDWERGYIHVYLSIQ